MLRLTLIRHGNAEWKDASIADFDRPLNKRGVSEAEGIGKVLMENNLVPELLLASTARRTQQTGEIVGRMLSLPTRRVKLSEQLYLARAEVILTLAQSTGPKIKHLAIVGHNPGLSELARSLATEETPIAELATGAACTLTFTLKSWASLASPATRAVRYDPPTKLFSLFS
ncbi:MAG: histidine phosphatase family protein [Gammaproteobacteria bacterium]